MIEKYFEKFNIVLSEILTQKGSILFFGALQRRDLENKYDILLSADWVTQNNSEEDLIYLISKLKQIMVDIEFLSQIVILKKDERFIVDVLNTLKEESDPIGEFSTYELKSGFSIFHMYVFAADTNNVQDMVHIAPKKDEILSF